MKVISILCLLFYIGVVQANFNISPLSQSIAVKEKSASYTLENLTDRKAAYQIHVAKRLLDPSGEELREPTKELRVFPSKIILEPNQKKRIKVIYLGKKKLVLEKSFRVVFMQLDRNVTENDDEGINAKFNFHTAFYVTPKNAQADIQATIENDGKGMILALKNQGNKHMILQDWQLKLSSDQSSVIYDQPLPDINLLADTQIFLPLTRIGRQYHQAEIILD